MNKSIEDELHLALDLMSSKWSMQNNHYDAASKFIYTANTVQEIKTKAKENNVDFEYALHRWYNFKTSTYCEQVFVDCGAKKEPNSWHHTIDIYIDDIPYDVKLTVYPQALSDKPYVLTTRSGRDEMIKWFYNNQSQQQRKHLANRMFIVCDGKDQNESLRLKSDFDQLRTKITNYMEWIKKNGQNKLTISDGGKLYDIYSEIIYLCSK